MVKVSRDRPRWPKGFRVGLRPRIFLTFGTTRVVGRQPYATAAFTPGEIPGTHVQRLSRPQGTWSRRQKIPSDTTENRSRDRPTSSAGPTPGSIYINRLYIYITIGSCCLYVFCYYYILSYSLGSFYKCMVVIYVFLLEEAMYSYCCLCILIVSLCILIVVYVFLLLSTYPYCCLCILIFVYVFLFLSMYSYRCLCILIVVYVSILLYMYSYC